MCFRTRLFPVLSLLGFIKGQGSKSEDVISEAREVFGMLPSSGHLVTLLIHVLSRTT